jgi:hypothetical protein
MQGSAWETEGRKYLQDLSVDGRIILKCIFKKWDRGINWIYLALNRNR